VVREAKDAGCEVIGDIELLHRSRSVARKIGITGTNGKSTTTSLVGHILKQYNSKVEIGGNLGPPALSLQPLGADGTYVLELSSYQLDLVNRTRFNIAALLNITPDHIDRHGGMEGYIASKLHIFDRQGTEDVAIIAVDDTHTQSVFEKLTVQKKQRVIPVSSAQVLEKGIHVDTQGVLHDRLEGEESFSFDLTPIASLTGQHNWQNAAVAYATARVWGLEGGKIAAAMKSFPGLPHRLELVASMDGVRFINDSKATNAEAAEHALKPYDTIYWIVGGRPKEGGIAMLLPWMKHVAHAFLIGEAEAEFARTLKGKAPFTHCGTLEHAFAKASAMAFSEKKKNAVVLLSPACASFDQWPNFEARGDAFRAFAQALVQKRAS
jgi:UDP-N-acetylmuramoylalanine--D-glutamate ligase